MGGRDRVPREGALVVLGAALETRVRIALGVVSAGATDKLTVLDPSDEDGERQFLASHVHYVGWLAKDAPSGRTVHT
jgi:hypothetical protein